MLYFFLFRLFLLTKCLFILGLDRLFLYISLWYVHSNIFSQSFIFLLVSWMIISIISHLIFLWLLNYWLLFFSSKIFGKISLTIALIVIIALFRVHRFFLFLLSFLFQERVLCNCGLLSLYLLWLHINRMLMFFTKLNDLRLIDHLLYFHSSFHLRNLSMLLLLSAKLNLFFLLSKIERSCWGFFSFPFII